MNGQKQQGMSMASMMMVGVLVAFFAINIIKLYPAYMDDLAVKDILESVASKPGMASKKPKRIYGELDRFFQINRIDSIKPENVTFQKQDDGTVLVEINYEVRVDMYANIDAVLTFKHSAVLSK